MQAKEPKLGLVGVIKATYQSEATKQHGEFIAQVDVTRDFSGKLPARIFVLSPGCCVCVSLEASPSKEVITIVSRGDDGLYHLAY
jgi:hypothetical protein